MATLRSAFAQLFLAADSTANLQMSDVIGNKTDTIAGSSIMAQVKNAVEKAGHLEDHFLTASLVYPTLANGVTVAAPAGAWTLGNEVEIIPAGSIASGFGLQFINVEAVSANDVFEIVLYNGAEIARERVSKISNQTGVPGVPIRSELQAAGTRISAKIACGLGGASTMTISLSYHLHP